MNEPSRKSKIQTTLYHPSGKRPKSPSVSGSEALNLSQDSQPLSNDLIGAMEIVDDKVDEAVLSNNPSPATTKTSSQQSILRSSPPSKNKNRLTRFQIVMNVKTAQDGHITEYVRDKLLKILQDISSFDKSVQLVSWCADDWTTNHGISDFGKTSPLPAVISQLVKYISAFRVPKPGQKKEIWSKLCLVHSCPVDDLLSNIQEVLQVDGWNMVPCRLQVEQSKTIGWLLYSCRHFQENDRLAQELSARFKYDMAIYWRKITGFTSNNNFQHALHVEVPSQVAREAVSFFSRLYGSNTNKTSWPLGIKMHLIPELANLPHNQKQECRDLCFRQSQFCQELLSISLFTLVVDHDHIISDKAGRHLSIRQAFFRK